MNQTEQEIENLRNINRELVKVANVNINIVKVNEDRIELLKRRLKHENTRKNK